MFDIVTGGAGFIGSHLVDALLEDGRDVRVIDNFSTGTKQNLERYKNDSRLEVLGVDVSNREQVFSSCLGAETVYHLAGKADIIQSIRNPTSYFDTNVTGTFNILEEARRAGVHRVVYAASSSCYGSIERLVNESLAAKARYPYALTKKMGEDLVLHWSEVYKIPAVSLRLFNVYGPRSRANAYGAVFTTFMAQHWAGQPLTVVGDGTQQRDFVHVRDVAQAFIKAATGPEGVYNIGSSRPITINRIAALIGGDVVKIPKRPGEPDLTWADITEAKSKLGWFPTIDIETGIHELLETRAGEHGKVWTPDAIAFETLDWFKCLEQ